WREPIPTVLHRMGESSLTSWADVGPVVMSLLVSSATLGIGCTDCVWNRQERRSGEASIPGRSWSRIRPGGASVNPALLIPRTNERTAVTGTRAVVRRMSAFSLTVGMVLLGLGVLAPQAAQAAAVGFSSSDP